MAVSDEPIYSGMCAFCACLLYGKDGDQSASSNRRSGHPIDKDGKRVEGIDISEIQPPALLRYSPALFAREAPEVFAHDPETNVLRLRDHVLGDTEPWIKPGKQEFLYCVDCFDRWISQTENTSSFVPFRDKASQGNLRPEWKERKRQIEAAREAANVNDFVEEEPHPEPPVTQDGAAAAVEQPRGLDYDAPIGASQIDEAPHDDDIFDFQPPDSDDEALLGSKEQSTLRPVPEGDDGAATPSAADAQGIETPLANDQDEDAPLLPEQDEFVLPEAVASTKWPSLGEYKAKWARLWERHNQSNPGAFGFDNLVPVPNWRLFQDNPGLRSTTRGHVLQISGREGIRDATEHAGTGKGGSPNRGPWVPFGKLQTQEAQARLSMCRPVSGMQSSENALVEGVERYAHNVGEVFFQSARSFPRRKDKAQHLARATLADTVRRRNRPGNALCGNWLPLWGSC